MDLLAQELRKVGSEIDHVKRLTRKTPILLLDVEKWTDSVNVTAAVFKSVPELASYQVLVKTNVGGERIARLDVAMAATVKLADIKKVTVGCSQCKIRLLERKFQCVSGAKRGWLLITRTPKKVLSVCSTQAHNMRL